MIKLETKARCSHTNARVTEYELNGKLVETPLFMPVGTRGSVKTLEFSEIEEMGYPIVLCNTYHMYLRPGPELVEQMGGLHDFIGWNGRILTDSGGFQVFSLKDLRKIDDEGVNFRSILDGSSHRFTPESVIKIQRALGADIIMAFDECAPHDSTDAYLKVSLERTHRWAEQCLEEFQKEPGHQNLFGIIQGALTEEYRLESQKILQAMPFDGIAIGGLSVGESKEDMERILKILAPGYDDLRPRYLMGVGTPPDFLTAVKHGIDMFDCVMPTRVARHGRVYTSEGELNLLNSRFKTSSAPMDPNCNCAVCKKYSAAYVHHLFKAKEITAQRLASHHNLAFFYEFMKSMREAIKEDRFLEFEVEWRARFKRK
jgi:queuine tRNA-ribosyltransferase